MFAKVRVEKSHLILLAVLAAILPWFQGGQEPIAKAIYLVAVLLGGLMLWRQPRLLKYPRNVLTWSTFGLAAWAALSLVWTVNRFETVTWLIVLVLGIIVFNLAQQLQANERLSRQLLNLYTGAAALFSFYGFYLYWTDGYDRLTSSFFWPNPFAIWLLPAVLIGAWWYAENGRRQDLLTTMFSLAAFYLTFSRTSLALLVVILVVMAFTVRRKAKFWGRLALLVACAAVVVVLANVMRHQAGIATTTSASARFNEAVSGQSVSLSDRIYYLRSVLEIWKHAPVIGSGAGTFPTVHPQYQLRVISASAHAHNLYAETLSDLGLVGFLLLVAVALSLLWYGWLGLKRERWKLPLFVGLAAVVVHLGMDFDASYPAMMMLAAALGGLAVAPGREVENRGLPMALVLAVLVAWPTYSWYYSARLYDLGVLDQDSYDFNSAANDYTAAHQTLVYDPAVLNAEGIMDYTFAKSNAGTKYEQQYLGQAEKLGLQGAAQDPHGSQQTFLLGRVYALAGDNRKAEEAYRTAITLDPYNHPEYYEDLVGLYLRTGDAQSAQILARQALPMYPESVLGNRHLVPNFRETVSTLWTDLGTADLALNETTQALADLRQAQLVNPSNHHALQLKNQILESLGQ